MAMKRFPSDRMNDPAQIPESSRKVEFSRDASDEVARLNDALGVSVGKMELSEFKKKWPGYTITSSGVKKIAE